MVVMLMTVELQCAFNCSFPIVGDIASICISNNKMILSAIW